MRTLLLSFLISICTAAFSQVEQYIIVNRDSFSPAVEKVTLNCYLTPDEDNGEMPEPQSSRYYECDSTGKWIVRIDTYSDGDESKDTVKYDPKTLTRVVVKSNDFEPSKSTTVFNKDGTVKSFLAQPDQRDAQFTEFEYDNAKRLTKKTLTFVENVTVETYSYDNRGRVLNYRRSSGSVTAKELQPDYEEKYHYNGDLSVVTYGFYFGANEQVRVRDTVITTYDLSHRIIKKVEKMENGSWKRVTSYEYDSSGRLIHENVQSVTKNGDEFASNKNMEYDSLGYYHLYVVEEQSYGYTNRWTTTYNEKGLPEECYYETVSETFHYVWLYEYR